MSKKQIELDFKTFILEAELYDTAIAKKFAQNLPYTVNLMQWGKELYGSIGINLGEENPVPEIPPGGIAYTSNGNYLCIFFGQTPAWSVEHIGNIIGDQWVRLNQSKSISSVIVRVK
ncbi:cyclophilin-like fold protein [Desulfobacterium sp. N47]|uniref:Cyclophilin TM1367-like domain-containing protein n=1 Tax=uncultured Desulfobacterium sp. TaxID=201089 RepID=E1YHG1_9BACT|nr:hypothetical protein N47_D28890 [uncultured Desulfobacterium sp.]